MSTAFMFMAGLTWFLMWGEDSDLVSDTQVVYLICFFSVMALLSYAIEEISGAIRERNRGD